jgi:hypothetical protein
MSGSAAMLATSAWLSRFSFLERFKAERSIEGNFPARDRPGKFANGVRALFRESDARQVRLGKQLSGRKESRVAELGNQPASHSRRTLHADLLSEDRPHGNFQTIPTSWDTHPRVSLYHGLETRIAPPMPVDIGRIRAEVEDVPHALDNAEQRRGLRKLDPQLQVTLCEYGADGNKSCLAIQRNGPAILG